MIEYILNLFKPKEKVQFLGILGEQNTQNVYDFAEVVAKASQPTWEEKPQDKWRTFLSQFQYQSSACVAFTVAKLAQILYFLNTGRKVKFSPGWIYKQRTPKVEGMWIDNAVNIAGGGLPTEELYPSEGLTEDQINNLKDVPYANGIAKEFAISTNWVNLPLNFDTVASTVQATKKGIMLWFEFGGGGEWFGNAYPSIRGKKVPYRHSVSVSDFTLFKGKQYIIIEDSADVSSSLGHLKLVSREFFDERCILARYPLNFKYEAISNKPKYDGSIKSLQDCLKFDGVMPSNIESTGYFGNITIQAVKDFQKKYNITQTGNVGPITKLKLEEIYGK